jgi:hypothetical protein
MYLVLVIQLVWEDKDKFLKTKLIQNLKKKTNLKKFVFNLYY